MPIPPVCEAKQRRKPNDFSFLEHHSLGFLLQAELGVLLRCGRGSVKVALVPQSRNRAVTEPDVDQLLANMRYLEERWIATASCHENVIDLEVLGWVYHDENLLVIPASASWLDTSPFSLGSRTHDNNTEVHGVEMRPCRTQRKASRLGT